MRDPLQKRLNKQIKFGKWFDMFHTIVNAVGKISKLLILQYTTSGKLSNMPNEVLNEQWIKLPRLDLTSNSVSLCE